MECTKEQRNLVESIFKNYLSRNRGNLEKIIDQLKLDITINFLIENNLIKRIAENSSQEHYERLVFLK